MYNYLPRSDSHSIALCRFIVQDLVIRSEVIREKAKEGRIAFGLNVVTHSRTARPRLSISQLAFLILWGFH